MQKNSKSTLMLAPCGVIAGLYVALSMVSIPVGAIQFRLSEGLTMLPLILPESIISVFIGCVLTNLITGCALLDIILGSVITLVAGVFTYFTGKLLNKFSLKIIVGGIFPVILNALFLPLIWSACYGAGEYVYIVQALLLLASQSVSVYGAGTIMLLGVKNIRKI
jgi:uncharacterized membrane protein